MILELNRPLPDDVIVRFHYRDLGATGKFMPITLTYMGACVHTHRHTLTHLRDFCSLMTIY